MNGVFYALYRTLTRDVVGGTLFCERSEVSPWKHPSESFTCLSFWLGKEADPDAYPTPKGWDVIKA